MYSASASAERVRERIRAGTTLALVADVVEDRVRHDLAIALGGARLAVVRCVESATPEDHIALATMISEGDFVWAGLVYGERDGPEIDSRIETIHVSELDRLVARLQELREAFGEAG